MKKMKNNLDEMQEQELLKIEHNGCWLVFWGLLVAMAIQSLAFGTMDFKTIAGEWIVFMILAVYLAIACVRKGIWDRRLQMNNKTNLIVSAIAAVSMGVFNAIVVFKNYNKPIGTIAVAFIIAGITFIVCFVILTFMKKATIRRKAKMEAEPLDANEM